jgi:hypothetical protein
MAFACGGLGSQFDGLGARFDDGWDKVHADGFDCMNICKHPWNWCLRVRGVRDLSVVIGMGYVNAWWCLHHWNLMHIVNILRGNGFVKFVGIVCT